MRKREEIKQGHERAVADQLLKVEKINAAFERVGNANQREPDCIYSLEGRTIGIEVATAYHEDSNAQDEWEIATGERPLGAREVRPSSAGILGNPDELICERVQHELGDKCGREYARTDETWLCINLNAALSDAQSVAECVKELQIPPKHGFDRIYLTYAAPEHEGREYVAIRIS